MHNITQKSKRQELSIFVYRMLLFKALPFKRMRKSAPYIFCEIEGNTTANRVYGNRYDRARNFYGLQVNVTRIKAIVCDF